MDNESLRNVLNEVEISTLNQLIDQYSEEAISEHWHYGKPCLGCAKENIVKAIQEYIAIASGAQSENSR